MSGDLFLSGWIDQDSQKKERAKAKELRRSQWWRQQLGRGVCYYCGEQFTKDQLTMDHKIPISRGGQTNKRNGVVACQSCNYQKKSMTRAEMVMEKLASASEERVD